MFRKYTNIFTVLLFLLSILVGFVACGVQGEPHLNQRPSIRITSYTGSDDPDDANLAPFQQTIYWAADDIDGVVVGYAYRVLDENRNPVATPGNYYIDELGEITPVDLRDMLDDEGRPLGLGWVMHYEKGADQTIPLTNPTADRTIWTDRVFVTINLPAHIDGKIPYVEGPGGELEIVGVPSIFEVVAIDNRGGISNVARKFFSSKTVEPSLHVSSSSGQLNDQETGQGIRVIFLKQDAFIDDVITVRAWYFEYQLVQVSIPTSVGGRPITSDNIDDWLHKQVEEEGWEEAWEVFIEENQIAATPTYITRDNERINEQVITTSTNPALWVNIQNDVKLSGTVIVTRVRDLAGVYSKPTYALFYVNDKYAPYALFYHTHSYALGDNYYIPDHRKDTETVHLDLAPFIYTSTGIRYAARFPATPIINQNGGIDDFEWAIVGDENTRFWFRWGYHGEYGDPNKSQPIDDPNSDWVGVPRDGADFPRLGYNYLTEITYYYIQLNGKPFPFGPLEQPGMQPDDPELNQYWLRVPANHEIAQRVAFSGRNATNGIDRTNLHSFKVMVEDLQGVRSEPNEFLFRIYAPTTQDERTGILYISNHTSSSNYPENLEDFYRDVIPNNMTIDFVLRSTLVTELERKVHNRIIGYYNIRNGRHAFPSSLLSQYKYVFYSIEGGPSGARLNTSTDQDGLWQYLSNQGNVILLGNYRYTEELAQQTNASFSDFYQYYFGWPNDRNAIQYLENGNGPPNRKYYFIGGTPVTSNLPILNPELDNNPDNNPHPAIIRERRGLGPISYFTDISPSAERLYIFNSKNVGQDDWSPLSEEERAIYHGSIVAFKKSNGLGTGYTFSFPIFHIQKENVRALFAEILQ